MTAAATGQIRLDIFADPVCPWCLIGKAELDRALESRPGHPFAITWQPFRLDPQMPPAGMPYTAYMKMKFGNEAGIIAAMKPVMEASERLGLWINPSLIERVPNTLNAHRLLHWAGLEGVQTPVMSGLMRAYWREGQNLSNPDVLVAIGEKAGIEPKYLLELLNDTGAKSFQMDVRGPWIAGGDFKSRFGLDLALKDVRLGCEMAKAWGNDARTMQIAQIIGTLACVAGLVITYHVPASPGATIVVMLILTT